MIRVRVIGRLEDWERLAPQWDDLVGRCGHATPFHRPQWLLSWWRHLGSGDLYVMAFEDGDALHGLLPLFIHEWNGRRHVTIAGTGITDFTGLVAPKECEPQCANLALEQLANDKRRWDLCDWPDLAGDSALLTASPFGLKLWPACEGAWTRSSLDIPPSNKLARDIRYSTTRLSRMGELRFETRRSADGPEVRELLELHTRRWQAGGGVESMLDTGGAMRALEEAGRSLSQAGMLRLYTGRLNDHLIAGIFALMDRQHVYGYMTGFDPEFARFSPGTLLLDYARRDAAAEGARCWEFLRGREPYKYQWGATEFPSFRLRVWHDERYAPSVAEREDHEPAVA